MSTADYTAYAGLARSAFHSALMEDFPSIDPAFKGLPWLPIEGKNLRIGRIAGANALINYGHAILSGADLEALHTDLVSTNKDFNLKSIVSEMVLDERIVRELSEPFAQEEFAVKAATEAVLQQFSKLFINGDEGVNPEEFDGLDQLTTANTKFVSAAAAAGDLLTELDRLISIIRAADGIPSALIMAHATKNAVNGDAIAINSLLPVMNHPIFGMRYHYCGVPILPNDHIELTPDPPNFKTSIYAVTFGEGVGLSGIYPARNGEMGVRVEKRHDDQNDTWYYKVKLECGLALYRESAVAEIEDVVVGPQFIV
jgi:hypothetical protein